MKKSLYVLCLWWGSISVAMAQQPIRISGLLTDTTARPIEGAYATLLSVKDSSALAYTVTDRQGHFIFENVGRQAYVLSLSYVGYRNLRRTLLPPATGNVLDAGTIRLLPDARLLSEVVVKGVAEPVKVKPDTVEFNAGSFKTAPNVAANDLIRRMPGVDVERDGSVTVQGQRVTRVLVDGKAYFGNDPALALQNLPADAIEKVQVLDRRSEQSLFSGVDDGNRETTINLVLREDRRNGRFGNASAAGGIADDRGIYDARLNYNEFNKNRRISVLGRANNINQRGFTADDATGQSQQGMRGGGSGQAPVQSNGIISSQAGGLNYVRTRGGTTPWGTNARELGVSYFLNRANAYNESFTDRLNLSNQGNFTTLSNSTSRNINLNHRLSLYADYFLDTLNSLRFSLDGNLSRADNSSRNFTQTFLENNLPKNDNRRINTSDNTNANANTSLLWRHRFRLPGRTLTAQLDAGLSRNLGLNQLIGQTRTFRPDSLRYTVSDTLLLPVRQDRNTDSQTLTYAFNTTYTEPIGKNQFLSGTYQFRQNQRSLLQDTYDITDTSRVKNNNLSNHFGSVFNYHRAGLSYRYATRALQASAGLNYQASILKGRFLIQDKSIGKTFQNVLPNANVRWRLSDTRNLSLNYNTNVNEPDINDMSPIVNNADPLNIRRGNPNLRVEYAHQVNFRYSNFNRKTMRNFNAWMRGQYNLNPIVDSVGVSADLVRTYKPINVGSGAAADANISAGMPITSLKLRFNGSLRVGAERSQTYVNAVENTTHRFDRGGSLRVDFSPGEEARFLLGLSGRVNWSDTYFSSDARLNTRFISQSYTADLHWRFLPRWAVNADYDWLIYNSSSSPQINIPILNAWLSAYVLKNNRGEIRLYGYNLFNQNQSVVQRSTANFVETQRTLALGTYGLVRFIYTFGRQQQQGRRGEGGNRPPGGFGGGGMGRPGN